MHMMQRRQYTKRAMTPDLLTTQQVQAMLRVDRTTIYRMVEDGRLPGIRVGKQWRFRRTEIEQWLKGSAANTMTPVQPEGNAVLAAMSIEASEAGLRGALPLACVQLIQDAFADMLGVMIIITDIQGRPITQPSNACGLYKLLMKHVDLAKMCAASWLQLAESASLEPRWATNEVGLLCARGLIHLDHAMAGMVIMGGIASEAWPPSAEAMAQMSVMLNVPATAFNAHVHEVYHLGQAEQDKALRCVQRIADIFSHIARDRSAMCGKLQAIASLTTL